MAPRTKLTKNWCVTSWIHKGAQPLEVHWKTHGPSGTRWIQYLAGQEELCPETGRRHYQWWFQTVKRVRFSAVLKLLPGSIHHLTPCDGTEEDNEKYVKKSETGIEGTVKVFGSFSTQGKPNTMGLIVEQMRDGAKWEELYSEHAEYIMKGHHAAAIQHAEPFLAPVQETEQYPLSSWPTTGGWAKAKAWLEGNRKTTLLLCGPPGCGKTKWCVSLKLNDKATFVAHTLDSLKQLAPKYSVLCLDDWDECLQEMGGAQLTQLFDRQIDVSVKCRFHDATIPRGTAVIVCSNDDLSWTAQKHPGVHRRTTIVHVEAWDMPEDDSAINEHKFTDLQCSEILNDMKEGIEDHSPHSIRQWEEERDPFQGIEAYYRALAAAEHREDTIAEHEARDDEPPPVLRRSNAQIVWSQHSTADAPRNKRKRSAEVIDLSDD